MSLASLMFYPVHGPFLNLWPMFVLPPLMALACDWAAARLDRRSSDAVLAGSFAVLPGFLALLLLSVPLAQAFGENHVVTWRGFLLWRLAPALAAGLLLRAGVLAYRRHRQVARLFEISLPAGAELAEAGRRVGVRVRRLVSADHECFVAGVIHPTVFVSDGAMRRLTPEALSAALEHEKAHVDARDTLRLALLAFVADCALRRPDVAIAAFVRAREYQADARAARVWGPEPLAESLLAMARPCAPAMTRIPLAGAGAVPDRLTLLLTPDRVQPETRGPIVALAMALAVAAAGLPTFQGWLIVNVVALPNCPEAYSAEAMEGWSRRERPLSRQGHIYCERLRGTPAGQAAAARAPKTMGTP